MKIEQFWSCVKIGAEDECWPWLGWKGEHSNGWYGYASIDGRLRAAHRVAFELTYGHIWGKQYICHRCDNPPCCNPRHLFAGTQRDNVHDMMRKHGREIKPKVPYKVPSAISQAARELSAMRRDRQGAAKAARLDGDAGAA